MSGEVDAYDRARRRVDSLVRDLGADALATPVAACPRWSVADAVAHLSAITVDVANDNLDGVGTDAFTARQVAERSDQPIAVTLDQWAEHAPALTGAFEGFPFELAAGPAVGDLYSHELDLRFALGEEIVVDDVAVAATIRYYVGVLGERLTGVGAPALRIRAGDAEVVAGEGEPASTVGAEPVEMMRALTGRRTLDEIRQLDWDGDVEPYVEVFSQYGATTGSLGETRDG